jgi:hypothetical protein
LVIKEINPVIRNKNYLKISQLSRLNQYHTEENVSQLTIFHFHKILLTHSLIIGTKELPQVTKILFIFSAFIQDCRSSSLIVLVINSSSFDIISSNSFLEISKWNGLEKKSKFQLKVSNVDNIFFVHSTHLKY